MKSIVSYLVKLGVITGSVCNSPILPVNKKGGNEVPYRFIIDLCALNKVVDPQFPLVPDVTTIFTMIPASAEYFRVIDLKNAFFSIPVHKESRYLFAFTLGGADTEEICKEGTVLLLTHLATHGHKASLKKFQYCQKEVAYLGYLLSKEGKRLTPERIKSISGMPSQQHRKV